MSNNEMEKKTIPITKQEEPLLLRIAVSAVTELLRLFSRSVPLSLSLSLIQCIFVPDSSYICL